MVRKGYEEKKIETRVGDGEKGGQIEENGRGKVRFRRGKGGEGRGKELRRKGEVEGWVKKGYIRWRKVVEEGAWKGMVKDGNGMKEKEVNELLKLLEI